MRRVILESPYAGNVESNKAYARRAMYDSLRRNEAPMVSHLLYTQVLDDKIIVERRIGIDAGHAWLAGADAVVVYADLGVSEGMKIGIARANECRMPVEYRQIGLDDA